jgi:ketosteroid isomerase-like protein
MTEMTEITVIDRMYAALVAGDVAGACGCYTVDAVIWHGFDRVGMTRDEAAQSWAAMTAHFPERRVSDVRRQPTPTGFVQQLNWHARTHEGKWMGWPVCIVVEIRDGLIARIDEYIDRAGWFEG